MNSSCKSQLRLGLRRGNSRPKGEGAWGRLRQPWRLDAAVARSRARWRLRREEGDDLPGGPARPADGTEAGWRRGPTGRTRETEAGWRHGPRGRVGRLAAGPNGPEVKENSFSNKNLVFDYSKALEICRRRFRRNFEVGIFPEFF
jgi:hypothetical protein